MQASLLVWYERQGEAFAFSLSPIDLIVLNGSLEAYTQFDHS